MLSAAAAQGTIPVPELPGLEEGLVATGTVRAGDTFLQGVVGMGEARRRFDDGSAGWRLVVRPGLLDGPDAELAAWFASLGGRVVSVGPGASWPTSTGSTKPGSPRTASGPPSSAPTSTSTALRPTGPEPSTSCGPCVGTWPAEPLGRPPCATLHL